VRRTAQQNKQAMPQMLGTRPLAPPQGMAHQQKPVVYRTGKK